MPNPPPTDDQVAQFASIFSGRTEGYGAVGGACIKREVTPAVYRAHLEHRTSVGIYPLLDDGTCWFFAIDFDRLKPGRSDGEVDSIALHDAQQTMAELRNLGLQTEGVYLERSKTKGAHVWVFFSDPVPAADIRRIARYAYDRVSGEKIEYFPKQDKLDNLEWGNYINLPYGPATDASRRVMLEPATLEPIPLPSFLRTFRPFPAELLPEVLASLPTQPARHDEDHPQDGYRYPCTAPMLAHGMVEGEGRNPFGFLLAKRLHAQHGDDSGMAALRAWNLNNTPPLSDAELLKVWQQGSRYQQSMSCRDDLVQPFCDTACPIHPSRRGIEYSRVRKILYEPPVYVLHVNGQDVYTNGDRLYHHSRLVVDILEQVGRAIPAMKATDWVPQLDKLMTSVTEIAVSESATASGQVWQYVCEFLAADRRTTDPDALEHGRPVVRGDLVYFFPHFLLRRLTAYRVPEPKRGLWGLWTQHGGDEKVTRFGKRTHRLWLIPLAACPDPEIVSADGYDEAEDDDLFGNEG